MFPAMFPVDFTASFSVKFIVRYELVGLRLQGTLPLLFVVAVLLWEHRQGGTVRCAVIPCSWYVIAMHICSHA